MLLARYITYVRQPTGRRPDILAAPSLGGFVGLASMIYELYSISGVIEEPSVLDRSRSESSWFLTSFDLWKYVIVKMLFTFNNPSYDIRDHGRT